MGSKTTAKMLTNEKGNTKKVFKPAVKLKMLSVPWPITLSLMQHSREGSAEVLKPDYLQYLCSSIMLFPFMPFTECREGSTTAVPSTSLFRAGCQGAKIRLWEMPEMSLFTTLKRSKNINWSIYNFGALSRLSQMGTEKSFVSQRPRRLFQQPQAVRCAVPHPSHCGTTRTHRWLCKTPEQEGQRRLGKRKCAFLHRSFCGTSQS